MEERRYQLTLSYDGTSFAGWQIQPGKETVQSCLQKALHILLGQQTYITGAGRTDAGVHAMGQESHFDSPIELIEKKFLHSLNSLLPFTIRATQLREVTKEFHARYSAFKKIYQYYLHLDPILDPFTFAFRYSVKKPLNFLLIEQSIPYLLGTKDFTAFANEAHRGCAANKPIKTLSRIECFPTPGGVYFEFEADGFLYKMVRNLIGGLLAVGLKKLSPLQLKEILESRDRRQAPAGAPAKGLFLKKVFYPSTLYLSASDSRISLNDV